MWWGRKRDIFSIITYLSRITVVDLRLENLEPLRDGGVGLGYERGHVTEGDLDGWNAQRPEAVRVSNLWPQNKLTNNINK